MPYRYKIDVLARLKEMGYTQYRLRKENILSDQIIRKLRSHDTNITLQTLDRICALLGCTPSDIIEFEPED